MTDVTWLTPDNAYWLQFLERCSHDFYHTPRYGELCAQQESADCRAVVVRDGQNELLLSLLVRDIPESNGLRDAISPYGYPSPLFIGAKTPAEKRRLLESLLAFLSEEGVVSAFIRLHPLLSECNTAYAELGELCPHGRTVYVDLSGTMEQIQKGIHKGHRWGLRKLHKNGFTVTLDDFDRYDEFVDVYRQTMVRKNADAFYFFPDEYFERLVQLRSDGVHLALVIAPNGDLAAGGIMFARSGIIQYHLSGSAFAYAPFAPSKLSVEWMLQWGKENGYKYFHIGGGLGGYEDSLFQYKTRFSQTTATYNTWRVIVRPEDYRNLCQTQCQGMDTPYFPAYRRGGRAILTEQVREMREEPCPGDDSDSSTSGVDSSVAA